MMVTTIRQDRPAIIAIIANRVLDAFIIFVGISVISIPFFAMVREIGLAFIFLGIAGALLILGRMLVDLMEREYSLYTLESDHLTVERGIINRQRIVIPMDGAHIQRVIAQQPFLGRLIGYGQVIVFTAGWGIVRLRYVAEPYSWQNDILKNLGKSTFPSISVQAQFASSNSRAVTSKSPQMLLVLSSLFILICICSLLFTFGATTIIKPAPTPTPAPGAIVFPNITGRDMLAGLWAIYQIPLIFWSVNAILLANIVLFVIGLIGKRQR